MSLLDDIQKMFALGEFEFSKHAADQAILRKIRVMQIQEAMSSGELIEDYPEDKYGPSCLIFGITQSGKPLHIHCSYPQRSLIRVVTVYEPDPDQWIDNRVRR